MLRYLGVSIVIGLLVSLLVGAFGEVGLFAYFGDLTFGVLHGSPLSALPDDADISRWWQYPVLVVVALAVAWTSVDIVGGWRKLTIAAAVVVLLLGLSFTLAVWGQLFEPLSGILAVAGSYLAGALHSRSLGGTKQKAFLSLLGGRRVSDGRHDGLRSGHEQRLDTRRALEADRVRVDRRGGQERAHDDGQDRA